MNSSTFSRRAFLSITALAATALQTRLSAADAAAGTKGHIHHSVCKWCYPKVSLDDLCAAGKDMGLTSIDLLQPADFPTLKKYGLICAMVSNPTIKGPTGDLGGITK